jgi:hypothetical protein
LLFGEIEEDKGNWIEDDGETANSEDRGDVSDECDFEDCGGNRED